MNKEDAQALAERIKREAPEAMVQVQLDGVYDYYVDVAGQVQYKFVIKSDEQWRERRALIVPQALE